MSEYAATLARPQTAPQNPPVAQNGSLLTLIRRIQEAVDEETDGIRANVDFDVAASNARKSRYLYDLNRASRGMAETLLRDEHREALAGLKRSLALNEQAILAHLNAVREVADIIRNAIRRAEADGTYSASEFSRE